MFTEASSPPMACNITHFTFKEAKLLRVLVGGERIFINFR
jgi:hypothetical protein